MTLTSANDSASMFKDGMLKPGIDNIQNVLERTRHRSRYGGVMFLASHGSRGRGGAGGFMSPRVAAVANDFAAPSERSSPPGRGPQ
jgi:hypothetical protein